MQARFCRARTVAAIEAPHWTEIETLAAALPVIDVVVVADLESAGSRATRSNRPQSGQVMVLTVIWGCQKEGGKGTY